MKRAVALIIVIWLGLLLWFICSGTAPLAGFIFIIYTCIGGILCTALLEEIDKKKEGELPYKYKRGGAGGDFLDPKSSHGRYSQHIPIKR